MGKAGRPTVAIELSELERETLTRWARRHSSSQALASVAGLAQPSAAQRPTWAALLSVF